MRAPNVSRLRQSVIEVERKFLCNEQHLRQFRANQGTPAFSPLESLGKQCFEDTYFDRDNILSANGIWVRRRDGRWQAKVRPDPKHSSFTNSQFEELTKPSEIAQMLRTRLNIDAVPSMEQDFGLVQMARFTTYREMWKANKKFGIVVDQTDFGHVVGEVELEQEIQVDDNDETSLARRQSAIVQMDEEIRIFMERYQWAFPLGKPVGKLSAYFARQR
ncbi:hypothetical protein LOZ53_000868 [Ophidiomyces ophidiicola]|uniref:uncharacterized protein n=1 Tax=Ophidiomyces ophidiicola TaxID=1387563 RepID=UPI0020C2D458|nr:uncharacterized protein LOZ57_000249 [Ophidiomyces ophidiicola]KAI1950802.1 hypothetical protein LOZ62_001845 [Ophidiomyces ophidiicola]KAI1953907.1 hypothetical protein LOZ57_000249 [Ophidiomyces ophidiicola]KAI1965449.1 hypothetical protein LOZ59_001260 [Ophidiomyces ophidiicola]KAI1973949.1 hypothetical protein LOZ56_001564 [Ophidiomyces ophidiicola]KAI1977331.1 hypothetical protein LOZ55_003567 [Ophidiomyces ophidiicola]